MTRNAKGNRKIWRRILIAFFLLTISAIGIYSYSLYNSVTKTVDSIHEPISREKSKKRATPITLEKKEPFSVLMLGVDERDGDSGRSDTMVVVTVNPDLNSVKMLSIPRDTRTEIIGKGFQDKINHAYAFGGAEISMDTVENLLDIPLDYYLQVNMEGFLEIVDAVGGVTVLNDFSFKYGGYEFPKGEIDLDGKKALAYSRMRYEDPRGDFGRQQRQREIIRAVIRKGARLSSLGNYDEILTALGNNVKTNLTLSEMYDIQSKYKNAGKQIEEIELKGTGGKIDGIYYYQVDDAEKQRVQEEFKSHLGIKK
ncbi:LytR family transcriptional regulator [Bacillus sp. ISL-45]|uniref:polyisoprenyl-teichoic acid--peptidoglycan teichoic acid transferase TagU n=1 Tax=Bacillus sp. ISL-45 TaxID=2819128 RepID=UPI001BE94634|nr:LytR family transcriptional regulator [Bacillus sp. ISL-45]MBT2661773.1 LytR family transcriptional regulator [Bacillus sp. ISL-45]